MKLFVAAVAALFLGVLLSLTAVPVQALETPLVTFIPERMGNDSVIVVVQGVSGQSVRVTWSVGGVVGGSGLLPKVGNKWMCVFSSDASNTCGPTPFLLATKDFGLNYSLRVETFDASGGRSNTSLQVETGSVQLAVDALNLNTTTNTLSMGVYTSAPVGGVEYKVYYAGNASLVGKQGTLVQHEVSGRYNGQVVLDGGEYFVAFTATPPADKPSPFGGTLKKVVVPEKAVVTTGGTVTPTEGASVFAEPFVARPLLRKGELFTGPPIRVINLKNQTFVNVSFEVPADLKDFFSVEMDDRSPIPFTLAPLDAELVRWTVKNVSAATDFNFFADIVSAGQKLGQMKVNVSVSVVRETGSGLSISPEPFVTGELLMGNISRLFDITNTGGKAASGLTLTFSDPELNRTVLATMPGTIGPKEKKTLTLLFSPASAGRKSGIITLAGGGEAVKVYVDVIFYLNISTSLENAADELDDFTAGLSAGQAAALKEGTDKAEDALADAQVAFDGGRYREAELTLAEASGMVAALKKAVAAPSGGGGTTTTTTTGTGSEEVTPPFILIAVLLVVLIGGLIVFLKKRGKGGGEIEEIEKELKEGGF